MANKNVSPKNQQRTRVFNAYRGRGKRNNNLWLLYSVKTNSDYIWPSDRQFIHWLFLETAKLIRSFTLAPKITISIDEKETRGTVLDALVELYDGTVEWHEVKISKEELDEARSQLLAQSAAASKQGRSTKFLQTKICLHFVK